MKTGLYRFLTKYGGFIWTYTQATLLYDKYDKPQNVLCVNFIVGSIEYSGLILSTEQTLKTETISLPDFPGTNFDNYMIKISYYSVSLPQIANSDLLDQFLDEDKTTETLLKPEVRLISFILS